MRTKTLDRGVRFPDSSAKRSVAPLSHSSWRCFCRPALARQRFGRIDRDEICELDRGNPAIAITICDRKKARAADYEIVRAGYTMQQCRFGRKELLMPHQPFSKCQGAQTLALMECSDTSARLTNISRHVPSVDGFDAPPGARGKTRMCRQRLQRQRQHRCGEDHDFHALLQRIALQVGDIQLEQKRPTPPCAPRPTDPFVAKPARLPALAPSARRARNKQRNDKERQ